MNAATFFKTHRRLLAFLFIGLAARLLLSPYFSYPADLLTYQLWSLDLIRHGFSRFYLFANSDYLPGYLYALWVVGKIFYFVNAKLFVMAPDLIFKIPSILADIANTVLIYLLLRKNLSRQNSVNYSLFYLFNPAFIFNSTLWGQSESFVTFFLLGSFYFLVNDQLLVSAALLAFGQASKPVVVLALLPSLIFILKKYSFRQALSYVLVFLLILGLVFLPFSHGNLVTFVAGRYKFTTSFWHYVTLNAFNLWALVLTATRGSIEKVQISGNFLYANFALWGKLLFLSTYAGLNFWLWRNWSDKSVLNSRFTVTLALVFLGLFLFMTEMHERHIYYALVVLTLALPFLSSFQFRLVMMGYVIYFLNLIFAYTKADLLSFTFSNFLIGASSFFNLMLFIYFSLSLRNRST